MNVFISFLLADNPDQACVVIARNCACTGGLRAYCSFLDKCESSTISFVLIIFLLYEDPVQLSDASVQFS